MNNAQQLPRPAAVQLPTRTRNLVLVGCFFLVLSVGMLGLSLSVLMGPVLTTMNAMDYLAIVSVVSSLGMVIMTPIGGKLGDLFGRRIVVLIAGVICAACGIALGFVKVIGIFILLRFLLSMAQGAFLSLPFSTAMEICDSKLLPTMTGLLMAASAVGTFLGSYIAGLLADAGILWLAISFPVLPLIIGMIFFTCNMPNRKASGNVFIDVKGMLVLVVTLTCIFVPLTFGGSVGWSSPIVLGGFAIGIIALFCFIKVEQKAKDPVIPLRLFKNKQYIAVLLVGFLTYFYAVPMNLYLPLAVQQVITGGSATLSGVLQLPRSILSIVIPIIAGMWVAKNTRNYWIALFISAVFSLASFAPLCSIGTSTKFSLLIICVSLTAFIDSLRAVGVTPLIRQYLDIRDIGIGMALSNFFNTAASLVSAAVNGAIYNAHPDSMAAGISSINIAVVIVSAAAVAVAVLGMLTDKKTKAEV